MTRRALAPLAMAVAACLSPAAPAAHAADPVAGRAKAQVCVNCHGVDGIGRMANVPHIAGESEIYLVAQLEAFRAGKRTHEIMSVIARDLSDADIADLAAWYARIEITATVPE